MCIHDKLCIGQDILAYLARNPDARDTLEGIVEWWLLDQQIERHVAAVEGALAELVAKELIVGRQGPESRTYYRLNRSKFGEIRLLLGQATKTASDS